MISSQQGVPLIKGNGMRRWREESLLRGEGCHPGECIHFYSIHRQIKLVILQISFWEVIRRGSENIYKCMNFTNLQIF
jgi:hypothetical protein